MPATVSLTNKELQKATVIAQVADKKLKQKEAATILQLSTRQVKRLVARYRSDGAEGLANKARGKPSNNRLDPRLKTKVTELIKTKYPDFGPTLAAEKLEELDGIKITVSSLRQAMIRAEIWKPKKQKAKHRARRERRACFGVMEQFDGCRHDWFEGRLPNGDWATLLASRDDANNHVEAWFLGYEGTKPVMRFWEKYFLRHGKPQSIYLDRHSTYKVNAQNALDDDKILTQFGRAMEELGIELINANSPQAKGRIENLFGTLQDRLVKELRLARISDIKAANHFLQTDFLPRFNARFCVTPASEANVHTPLAKTDTLNSILSIQNKRYINQDFTIRFKNTWYQLTNPQPTLVLPGKQVILERRLDSTLHIRLDKHYLNYTTLEVKPQKTTQPIALTSNPLKTAEQTQTQKPEQPKTPQKPAPNHPWRKLMLLPYNVTNRPNQKTPSKKWS